jgi:hypothetical protein
MDQERGHELIKDKDKEKRESKALLFLRLEQGFFGYVVPVMDIV